MVAPPVSNPVRLNARGLSPEHRLVRSLDHRAARGFKAVGRRHVLAVVNRTPRQRDLNLCVGRRRTPAAAGANLHRAAAGGPRRTTGSVQAAVVEPVAERAAACGRCAVPPAYPRGDPASPAALLNSQMKMPGSGCPGWQGPL